MSALRNSGRKTFFLVALQRKKTKRIHTNIHMQIQWLKGEEQVKHRLPESQCYAKEGEEARSVCKHITDFFVSLQARDAKLTPQNSLISVTVCQLHELLAPPPGPLSSICLFYGL